MSEQDKNHKKVSEFAGRRLKDKPSPEKQPMGEFNSEANIHLFNMQLANLINTSTASVALITVVGSLEIMKADILSTKNKPEVPEGAKH